MRTALVAIMLVLLPAVHAATVSGRLVSKDDNRPLADISVSFLANTNEADAAPLWTGRTGADGRFLWAGAPNGAFTLIVNSDQWGLMLRGIGTEAEPHAPGFGVSQFPVASTRNGDHNFGDIALVPGGAIRVTALDE
jgi:hypothetical protein